MFDQIDFGKRVRSFRLKNSFSQKELGMRIGVSEQAVSKWEKGECLPDVYNLRQYRAKVAVQMRSQIFRQIVPKFRRHTGVCQEILVQSDGKYASSCTAKAKRRPLCGIALKLLAQLLRVSVDCLLDTEMKNSEKVMETVTIGGVRFDIVEKPETILAGRIIYAKEFPDEDSFNRAIDSMSKEDIQSAFDKLKENALPVYDINLILIHKCSIDKMADRGEQVKESDRRQPFGWQGSLTQTCEDYICQIVYRLFVN